MPRRNPDKPATDAAKAYEIGRQLRIAERQGGSILKDGKYHPETVTRFILRALQRERAEFLHANEDILTTTQKDALNMRAVTVMTDWEKRLAATLTVGQVETIKHEEDDEEQLHEDAEKIFAQPHRFYEGQEQPLPFRELKTDSKPATSTRLVTVADFDEGDEDATAFETTQQPMPKSKEEKAAVCGNPDLCRIPASEHDSER